MAKLIKCVEKTRMKNENNDYTNFVLSNDDNRQTEYIFAGGKVHFLTLEKDAPKSVKIEEVEITKNEIRDLAKVVLDIYGTSQADYVKRLIDFLVEFDKLPFKEDIERIIPDIEKWGCYKVVREYYAKVEPHYVWNAYSDDGSFEDFGGPFDSREECYNDMRAKALEKMKWNTEFAEDLEELGEGEYIGYSVQFSQDKITHKSYSGLYTYEINETED